MAWALITILSNKKYLSCGLAKLIKSERKRIRTIHVFDILLSATIIRNSLTLQITIHKKLTKV